MCKGHLHTLFKKTSALQIFSFCHRTFKVQGSMNCSVTVHMLYSFTEGFQTFSHAAASLHYFLRASKTHAHSHTEANSQLTSIQNGDSYDLKISDGHQSWNEQAGSTALTILQNLKGTFQRLFQEC